MTTVAVDELALADLNFAEMCRAISRNAGGRVLEVDGLVMWSGTHPSPALINGLIRTRDARPPVAEIFDLAERWFGEIGHAYSVHVRLGKDDDLEAAVKERGLERVLDLPVMVYKGPLPDFKVPDGYTIARVTDAEGVHDVLEAVAAPFEMPDEIASVLARPESVLSPFTAAVVARDRGGRPVAAAWTLVSHGVAGIGLVGTLEHARGRGLGAAVTWAAMRAGYEMGATSAALQASPMGLPVYARMGYREVGAYRIFADTAGH
jgi:GNAT superfamily N-acetyltransferase